MRPEFYISVTPIGVNEYRVQTAPSLPGVPATVEELRWPVPDWLAQAPDCTPVTMGRTLYHALFQGAILQSWQLAQRYACQEQMALEVRLELNDEKLLYLPWETLEDYYEALADRPKVNFFHFYQDQWDTDLPPTDAPPEDESLSDTEYEEDSAVIADLFRQIAQSTQAGLSVSPEPDPPEEVLSPTESEPPVSTPTRIDRPRYPLFMIGVGGAILVLTILGTLALFLPGHQRLSSRELFTSESELLSEEQAAEMLPLSRPIVTNFQKADLQVVQTIALRNLQQGNLKTGQQAVEALLDRDALSQAAIVLAKLPPSDNDPAGLTFLRGRLIWQFIRHGDKRYTVAEAQQYWEAAVKQQPNVPLYHNALGFAYYSQNKLVQADRAWFQALFLLQEKQVAGQNNASKLPIAKPPKEMAVAYAGLTLVLTRSAAQQPADQRTTLLNRANKIYLEIMDNYSSQFSPEALGKDWLWQPQAISDWEALAKQF